ncbi:major capsid protein P2 [Marinimicrobium agarilyticum]|uniref:major capsid protein P2 n=1 Tax=Marinimicrobium agarilyticum TaxID=306546 RepID=UPI00040CA5F8|nr:major capsid protein P2 [Marinimicrobium agarilyticum]
MLLEQRMPPFEGVAAGNQALLKLPIGRRFHHLFLKYSGVTLAQMTEIRILANGKVFQRFSGTQRDKMNQFVGLAAANGILQIPFERMGLKNRDQQEATAINTNVFDKNGRAIKSLQVEIDIHPDATAPSLEMRATQSAPVAGGPGIMLNIMKASRNIAGQGELEVSDYTYGTIPTMALNRAYFIPSANQINKVTVERELYNIWERDTALNEWVQNNSDAGRNPVSGWWVLDTTERGYGANQIGLAQIGENGRIASKVQDFRIKFDCSGAMTVDGILEYTGLLGD